LKVCETINFFLHTARFSVKLRQDAPGKQSRINDLNVIGNSSGNHRNNFTTLVRWKDYLSGSITKALLERAICLGGHTIRSSRLGHR
jgi:hypothetical protein